MKEALILHINGLIEDNEVLLDIKEIKNIKLYENQDIITRTALESTIKILLIVELDRMQNERELIVKKIKQGIEASDKKVVEKKAR